MLARGRRRPSERQPESCNYGLSGMALRTPRIYQDCLIKKQCKRSAAAKGANEYLENEYLPAHNRRFTRPPGGVLRAFPPGLAPVGESCYAASF